jgi:hypothetical protein
VTRPEAPLPRSALVRGGARAYLSDMETSTSWSWGWGEQGKFMQFMGDFTDVTIQKNDFANLFGSLSSPKVDFISQKKHFTSQNDWSINQNHPTIQPQ